MSSNDDLTELIASHRAVADLLEAHPDLLPPFIYKNGTIAWLLWPFECPDGVPAMVASIRRIVGGKWDKRESKSVTGIDELVFARDGYEITVRRENVCTRRVVGTVTETVPAVEAQPERTVEREVVEWDCAPVLAGDKAEAVSA